MSILYFCPSSTGGIAQYASHHCAALAEQGASVSLLCPKDWALSCSGVRLLSLLEPEHRGSHSRFLSRLQLASRLLHDIATLDRMIGVCECRSVMMATYSEYLAPLWAWRFRRWRRRGVCFAAVVHDPVRDYRVGPLWWHRWSMHQGYSFLRDAFVHESIDLDTGSGPRLRDLRVSVVPHGPFTLPSPQRAKDATRGLLGVKASALLALCFGHLRDGKNLQLILHAMTVRSDLHLMVAGTEAPPGQTSSRHFRQLALELGVADRCHWRIGYVPDEEAADLFGAADLVLLTYGSTFRSASGVLQLAVHHRLPVLVSCGQAPLGTEVEIYGLGLRIAPDSADAIASALVAFPAQFPRPDWDAYIHDHSWSVNARRCLDAIRQGNEFTLS